MRYGLTSSYLQMKGTHFGSGSGGLSFVICAHSGSVFVPSNSDIKRSAESPEEWPLVAISTLFFYVLSRRSRFGVGIRSFLDCSSGRERGSRKPATKTIQCQNRHTYKDCNGCVKNS
jgi:hypothetical protein